MPQMYTTQKMPQMYITQTNVIDVHPTKDATLLSGQLIKSIISQTKNATDVHYTQNATDVH